MKKYRTLFAILLVYLLVACKKETFIESGDALMRISTDSLHFDTVFTSTGSITQFFRIHNENDQKLRIASVKLAGGNASPFKINVDGLPGPEVSNLEIAANDSLYIFVSVHIDPTSGNLPFVVQDSVRIDYNGNTRWVQLEAWGQNANFLRARKLTGNVVWTNTLPYVILGGILVDTNATLIIEKGTKIYLHADAPFIVDGTLKVQGEKFDSTRVYFTGDRLDEPYKYFPASWPGIYFRGSSRDNQMDYAIIRNGYQGIVVEQPSLNANPKVTLNQCIIDNMYDVGLFGVQSNMTVNNCLVSNCGKNVILAYGGTYNFTNTTVVTYSNQYLLHKEPVLQVTNFIKQNNNILTADLSANFRNCIFWGENGAVDDEVFVSKQGNNAFTVNFINSLWKVKTNPTNTSFTNGIANSDPQFDSIEVEKRFYNFRLKPTSPAINKGIATSLTVDLDGNPRAVGLTDLGAYEKQ